jgi:hypothetical protein
MSCAEIAGLLELMRGAPPGRSIAELRANMTAFIPFIHRYAEMPHAFLQLPATEAEAALGEACAFLKDLLRGR